MDPIQGFADSQDSAIQGFADSGIRRFKDSPIQGFAESGIPDQGSGIRLLPADVMPAIGNAAVDREELPVVAARTQCELQYTEDGNERLDVGLRT